jgi:hypothetical protein
MLRQQICAALDLGWKHFARCQREKTLILLGNPAKPGPVEHPLRGSLHADAGPYSTVMSQVILSST